MFYGEKSKIQSVVGARVETITYTDGCESFGIHTSRGTLYLRAEPECCSESWFQAFDGFEDLIGHVILGIEERDEERDHSDDEPCRQEVTQLYGAVFSYSGGSAYLELRNDSNGYYGGSVSAKWHPKKEEV